MATMANEAIWCGAWCGPSFVYGDEGGMVAEDVVKITVLMARAKKSGAAGPHSKALRAALHRFWSM